MPPTLSQRALGALRAFATPASTDTSTAPKRPTPTFGESISDTPSRNVERETHPWIQADVDRIHNAILENLRGRPAQLQDIFDDIIDRDDRVSACSRTRALALVGRPWAVKPAPGMEQDADAAFVAEQCHDIMQAIPRWPLVVGELGGDGINRGLGVQEIVWGVDRKGRYVPKNFKWKAPNRFVWQPETLKLARKDMLDPYWGVALDDLKPDGFVVHTPKAGRPSYVTRGGVLISIVIPALSKKHGNKWWFKGLERDGVALPILKIEGNQDTSPELIAEGKKILRNMAASWGAVLWGGMSIEKAGGTGEFDGTAHEKLVNLANTSIAIALLGQNLTTEVTGGSFAAANAHNFVRGDLLANDLVELAVTVREQVLERIVRFNWPGAPVPIYETTVGQKQAPSVEEVEAGLYTDDEARSGKGWAPKADGAGSKYRTPPVAAPAFSAYSAPTATLGGAAAAPPFRAVPMTVVPTFPTSKR